MWLMKSGASIWCNSSRSALPSCVSKKRRTNGLLSSADIEVLLLANSHLSPLGRHHEHDATRRALAHRLEPYSPKLVDEGPRGSILLIPSTHSTPPLEAVAKALRSHSRGCVGVVFTINTKTGETTCVLHLHIPGTNPCPRGWWCGRISPWNFSS